MLPKKYGLPSGVNAVVLRCTISRDAHCRFLIT
jgi:hypothetical protein